MAKKNQITKGDSRKRGRLKKTDNTERLGPLSPEGQVFPVVGIGASAGGLEAFESFFTNMPPDSGMAFVLIQHLDPKHKSILSELLRRYTRMPVSEVQDGMTVEPNHVYVIPPNRNMALMNRKLHLVEATETLGLRTPIDYFFRSLAQDLKDKAICIVLSGTGTEGAMGLRAIKGEGGMVMVQEPESAKYDGMPRSAIATGIVDYVLPPEKMPEQLIRYVRHQVSDVTAVQPDTPRTDSSLLQRIFLIIRSQTGHDFSFYKQNTILRRIERRMAVNQITRLADYVHHMQNDPKEAVILFKELLIGVTNFFRDREAFDALRDKVIPKLLGERLDQDPVRIWVPGCATGEEAYSIGMLCQSFMNTTGVSVPVQIFATDIDGDAIESARLGVYPDSIAVDVPSDFLVRYFSKEDGSFRVKKEIRDKVVFALQNVITDPPFSKIDLISCRNLLIYLGPSLQKRVLSLFHYSLKRQGFLFLGSSETIGEFSDYFSVMDRKWKLFKRKETEEIRGKLLDFQAPTLTDRRIDAQIAGYVPQVRTTSYREIAEKTLLESYGPSAVLISEKSDILYIHGRVGKYLEPPSGEFTGNIVAMAREGLKLALLNAIRRVALRKSDVRIDRVSIKTNGGDQLINLVVKPVSRPPAMEGLQIVIFEDIQARDECKEEIASRGHTSDEDDPRIAELEQELRSTKEYLQTTIEELETTNEELKSTNEELQSSNEELQSTNEEMETSKEELQSINEELTTVNAELQQKIEELSKTSSDLNNLLTSTQIGTIFLDRGLRVQRFTPTMSDILNLIPTDVGRPISHIVPKIRYGKLTDDAKRVLETLVPRETEIQSEDDRWFFMRILPYRTIDNVIDGVVITFVDITQLKATESRLKEEIARRKNAQIVLDSLHTALLILNPDLRVVTGTRAFCNMFSLTQDEIEGVVVYELRDRSFDTPLWHELLETILPQKGQVVDFRVDHVEPGLGHKRLYICARQVAKPDGTGEEKLTVLIIDEKPGMSVPF
jgi:two-component system CheB/CheR fusion protein